MCSRPFCISLAPARLDRYPLGFTGHVAPLKLVRVPSSLAATHRGPAAAGSLIPVAPLKLARRPRSLAASLAVSGYSGNRHERKEPERFKSFTYEELPSVTRNAATGEAELGKPGRCFAPVTATEISTC